MSNCTGRCRRRSRSESWRLVRIPCSAGGERSAPVTCVPGSPGRPDCSTRTASGRPPNAPPPACRPLFRGVQRRLCGGLSSLSGTNCAADGGRAGTDRGSAGALACRTRRDRSERRGRLAFGILSFQDRQRPGLLALEERFVDRYQFDEQLLVGAPTVFRERNDESRTSFEFRYLVLQFIQPIAEGAMNRRKEVLELQNGIVGCPDWLRLRRIAVVLPLEMRSHPVQQPGEIIPRVRHWILRNAGGARFPRPTYRFRIMRNLASAIIGSRTFSSSRVPRLERSCRFGDNGQSGGRNIRDLAASPHGEPSPQRQFLCGKRTAGTCSQRTRAARTPI